MLVDLPLTLFMRVGMWTGGVSTISHRRRPLHPNALLQHRLFWYVFDMNLGISASVAPKLTHAVRSACRPVTAAPRDTVRYAEWAKEFGSR